MTSVTTAIVPENRSAASKIGRRDTNATTGRPSLRTRSISKVCGVRLALSSSSAAHDCRQSGRTQRSPEVPTMSSGAQPSSSHIRGLANVIVPEASRVTTPSFMSSTSAR